MDNAPTHVVHGMCAAVGSKLNGNIARKSARHEGKFERVEGPGYFDREIARRSLLSDDC